MLTIYRRYRAGLVQAAPKADPRAAIEDVQAYAKNRGPELHDLAGGTYPNLTDAQLDKAAGFLRQKGGATWLLMPPDRWNAEFGSRAKAMLGELKSGGHLKTEKNSYQSQAKVRASKNKDRVYMVKIG